MLELAFGEPDSGPSSAAVEPVNSWSDDNGVVFARAFDHQQRWIDWAGLGRFVFSDSPPRVTLHAASTINRAFATDVFRRLVQPIILQALGREVLHASAVAGPDGAIVLCGVSGSGKSTLAWALATRPGFEQVADDAVVLMDIEPDGDGPRVLPLPHRPRLRAASQAVFPTAAARMGETTTATAPLPPLRLVVLLTQDESVAAGPLVRQLSAVEAFPALVTHAYCFNDGDPDGTRRMVEHYLALAAVVPVVSVTYRPDFSSLPQLLDAIDDVAVLARAPVN